MNGTEESNSPQRQLTRYVLFRQMLSSSLHHAAIRFGADG